jgi:nitrilase
MAKVSAIQLCSTPDISKNLQVIDQQLANLAAGDDHLVVLPEACLLFGCSDKQQLLSAQSDSVTMTAGLTALAKKYAVYLVGGTIPLPTEDQNKHTASSLLISPDGTIISEYQKMHLFDVSVNDNAKNYCESRYTLPGNQLVCSETRLGKVGMTVCYDLRFPELFRGLAVKGDKIITVPAAFTRVTGKAHWQPLLQARAIENQVYIVAAGQEGIHANGRETWGHSMIINPWGEIVAQRQTGEGIISTDLDMAFLTEIRNSIPVAEHNRFKVELS